MQEYSLVLTFARVFFASLSHVALVLLAIEFRFAFIPITLCFIGTNSKHKFFTSRPTKYSGGEIACVGHAGSLLY